MASPISSVRPVPRADRRFYASSNAFGRFGIRAFAPVAMDAPHSHGHIEFNWVVGAEVDYQIDGRGLRVPQQTLIAFWAGIPHQATEVVAGPDARQLNIYLPMDIFLQMPQLGALTEILMGGGVIAFPNDCVGQETLDRWYGDYRSGNAKRADLARAEIGTMFRRAALIGWDNLMPAWIEAEVGRGRGGVPTRYVVVMVQHIIENLGEPLRIEDVAEVVGLHPNYALSLFSKVMHMSIQKFVTRMRVIRARSMLFETSLSIANVAFQAGFSSQSQFYEHFRKAYGVTPMQMRLGG
jgi:AraC-like DNA-binding protein